jgi:hypothetical protein
MKYRKEGNNFPVGRLYLSPRPTTSAVSSNNSLHPPQPPIQQTPPTPPQPIQPQPIQPQNNLMDIQSEVYPTQLDDEAIIVIFNFFNLNLTFKFPFLIANKEGTP